MSEETGAGQMSEDSVAVVADGYMGKAGQWCWWDEDYPDEGSVGPFDSKADADGDARDQGYRHVRDFDERPALPGVVRVEFKDEGACHEILEANPEAHKYFAHSEYGTVEINVRTLACRLVAPGEG